MSLLIDTDFNWNPTIWNPSMITTALWLDAADAATVTAPGGVVEKWNDKSGNGRNAIQATTANKPTYTTASQNGLNILTFDGSNDSLLIASTALFNSGNTDLAIFAAYKSKHTAGSSAASYGALLGNYTAGNFIVYFGGNTAPIAGYVVPWGMYCADPAGFIDIDSGSYTQNANYLISAVRSSGSFTGWTDGTQKNTVINTGSVYKGSNTESVWRVGSNTVLGECANMDLYELICINGTINSTTRQQCEGYLAHKWGLTANLPAGHPYKTVGPRP